MLENHVAEYKEKVITCSSCKGTGMVVITKEEVFEIMEHTTTEHALRVYKQWRTWDGSIDCCDCSGEGSWVVRL